MASQPGTGGIVRTPVTPAIDDDDAAGFSRRVRLGLWVAALTVRSAVDVVQSRGTRHA